jgi:hypothetical protein
LAGIVLRAVLVALLVVPLAMAQGSGVSIKAPGTVQSSLDEPAVVEVTVTNTAAPSGVEALDRPRLVTLSTGDGPAGWTARVAPSEFRLAPGQSAKATLTVSVSASAAETASLTVTARMYPLGVNTLPIVGPEADPESTAAASLKATRVDSVTRDVLESLGPYVWVVLLGFVAAVVLALSILAANRRIAVRLSSAETAGKVPQGGRSSFPLRVHNITRQADTVFLRVNPLPEGWNAYLPTPQLELQGGQQEEVSVFVVAPKGAEEGTHLTVDVTATSSLAPRRPATVRFEATVATKRKGQA